MMAFHGPISLDGAAPIDIRFRPRHMTQASSSWPLVTAEGCVNVGASMATIGVRDGIMFHI